MILEAKVRKPRSELNPGVWQGDCCPGIDQNRSKMFRRPGMHMPVLWRADSHCPDDRAEIPHPAIGFYLSESRHGGSGVDRPGGLSYSDDRGWISGNRGAKPVNY